MTPPIRHDWTAFASTTLAGALLLAEHHAREMQAAHTVVARIQDGMLGFDVMLSASYAELREQGSADRISPVASALPSGVIDLYRVLAVPFTPLTPVRGD